MKDNLSRKRAATALDVAKLAEVSQSTVSRVFNARSGFSVRAETRERVLKAARELGYTPNAIAHTMASGRSDIIGVVVPSSYNLYHYNALQIITNTLKRYSLRTMVLTSEPFENIEELLGHLMQYQVDGVIITSAVLGQHMTGRWERTGLPIVVFNSDIPGADINTVQSDHFNGGVLMAQHLYESGYRRFAYVSAQKSPHLNLRSRQEGFLSGLRTHGISDCQIIPAAYSYESGLKAGHQLLQQRIIPDAVFCGGDINGFGVIDAIRTGSNLRLGVDIAVAGYDAPILEQLKGYSMTALSQPTQKLAEDAVAILLEQIDEPGRPPVHILEPLTLYVRASTRPNLLKS